MRILDFSFNLAILKAGLAIFMIRGFATPDGKPVPVPEKVENWNAAWVAPWIGFELWGFTPNLKQS